MATRSEAVSIEVDDEAVSGTFLTPTLTVPGVLFVHGWGGSQKSDLDRAKGIAGLGCVCLTFDLRGHGETQAQQQRVSREHSLRDIVSAYDRLAAHPEIHNSAIAVVGSSYGGYLSAILSSIRPVKWLALHVPALYRDEDWTKPKRALSRADLTAYRSQPIAYHTNRALRACQAFHGDVLLVESEHDDYVPHSTVMSYRAAFQNSHSLTHRIVDGADHAFTSDVSQQAYTSILVSWITEMVIGVRVGGNPRERQWAA